MKTSLPQGFSLLELLVVATIMLSMTGYAVARYQSFTQVQRLRQAGRTFKINLRQVQTKATSGDKPAGCTTLDSYEIVFAASTYSYRARCRAGFIGPQTTYTLPSGVTFSPIPSPILFAVLKGSASRNGQFILTSFGSSYRIDVSSGGDINDRGLQ